MSKKSYPELEAEKAAAEELQAIFVPQGQPHAPALVGQSFIIFDDFEIPPAPVRPKSPVFGNSYALPVFDDSDTSQLVSGLKFSLSIDDLSHSMQELPSLEDVMAGTAEEWQAQQIDSRLTSPDIDLVVTDDVSDLYVQWREKIQKEWEDRQDYLDVVEDKMKTWGDRSNKCLNALEKLYRHFPEIAAKLDRTKGKEDEESQNLLGEIDADFIRLIETDPDPKMRGEGKRQLKVKDALLKEAQKHEKLGGLDGIQQVRDVLVKEYAASNTFLHLMEMGVPISERLLDNHFLHKDIKMGVFPTPPAPAKDEPVVLTTPSSLPHKKRIVFADGKDNTGSPAPGVEPKPLEERAFIKTIKTGKPSPYYKVDGQTGYREGSQKPTELYEDSQCTTRWVKKVAAAKQESISKGGEAAKAAGQFF